MSLTNNESKNDERKAKNTKNAKQKKVLRDVTKKLTRRGDTVLISQKSDMLDNLIDNDIISKEWMFDIDDSISNQSKNYHKPSASEIEISYSSGSVGKNYQVARSPNVPGFAKKDSDDPVAFDHYDNPKTK